MKKKLLVFAAFSFFPLLLFGLARAANINVTIPGIAAGETSNPGGWVAGLYRFSLMAAGLLAFGMIVYAGLRYTFATGNPSTQTDARDQILQALLGLLLLLGAFIALTTINPGLVNLQLPGLAPINNQNNNNQNNNNNTIPCGTGICSAGRVCITTSQGPACQNPDELPADNARFQCPINGSCWRGKDTAGSCLVACGRECVSVPLSVCP